MPRCPQGKFSLCSAILTERAREVAFASLGTRAVDGGSNQRMQARQQIRRAVEERWLPASCSFLLFILHAFAIAAQPSPLSHGQGAGGKGGPVAEGRVEARTLYVAGARKLVRHLVFTPSDYATKEQRRWPLIVGLHGTAGDPEQVMGFQRLMELAERYGYLVVCPYSSGTGDLHRNYVLQVLDDTLEQYRVHPDRVFLLGFSRGGAGVWGLGANHPERWAGLAPISPATGGNPAPLERMRDLPIIVVIGDQDKAVSLKAVRRWVRRMGELGMTHQFVELPGVGHNLSKLNFLPLVFEFFERQ